ncbi:two-component sensor histidine kinase, partial [Bacillus cereus]|nr:two-component sensor histidine kinase [Bacillus cereus]
FYRIEKQKNRNTGGFVLWLYIVKQILDTLYIKYSMKNMEHSVQFCMSIPLSKHKNKQTLL